MRVCILCDASKVDDVRDRSKKIFNKKTMVIPLSLTGKEPITHWFCFLDATEKGYDKLKELQINTIIEISSPKEFLKKNNLQIINTKKR